MKGGKKLTEWNLFVQKVYQEGQEKDPEYEFKNALVDASKRKSEMGSVKSDVASGLKKSRKVSNKSKGKRSLAGGRKKNRTQKRRRHSKK